MNTDAIVDSRDRIAQLDEANMLGSIEALADQVKHAWEDTQKLSFTPKAEIRNVVVAGMGGSGLGADVIKNLFKDILKVPFEVVNSYTLPGYVNENTLVVLSSYSGTTEETLASAEEAQRRNAQIMIITGGGDLAALAKEKGYSAYIIDPKHNPSNQPRMAIGYSIMGTLGLLSHAGLFELTKQDVEDAVAAVLAADDRSRVDVPQEENEAKLIALHLVDRRGVFVTSEHLIGATHTSTNQFNENAKSFLDYKVVPEINHHLMEGLRFPASNANDHIFIFLTSDLYHPRNQARMKLTQQVVEQQDIETLVVKLRTENKLAQVFELITLLAYANFYLAMLENINPTPIPFVDWFKDELKKV